MSTILYKDTNAMINDISTISATTKSDIVLPSLTDKDKTIRLLTYKQITSVINSLESAYSGNCCESDHCQSCQSSTNQSCQNSCTNCTSGNQSCQSCQSTSNQSCQNSCTNQSCQDSCTCQGCQKLTWLYGNSSAKLFEKSELSDTTEYGPASHSISGNFAYTGTGFYIICVATITWTSANPSLQLKINDIKCSVKGSSTTRSISTLDGTSSTDGNGIFMTPGERYGFVIKYKNGQWGMSHCLSAPNATQYTLPAAVVKNIQTLSANTTYTVSFDAICRKTSKMFLGVYNITR